MGTTNHYRAFPLPIGTLTAVGRTADLVARITVAVVFAETAFDSIGDFVATEDVSESGVEPRPVANFDGELFVGRELGEKGLEEIEKIVLGG